MRTLGIDFGDRRIGLAISDPEGRVAVPLRVLERKTDRRAARQIAAIARDEGVESLVLGDPRRLDGGPGERAARVRRFAARLEEASGLPVELADEALTSVEAQRRLSGAGTSTRRHPERIDLLAAQILLQDRLDQRLDQQPGEPGEVP